MDLKIGMHCVPKFSKVNSKICRTFFLPLVAYLIDDEVGAFCEGAVPLGVVRPRVVVDVGRLGVRLPFLRWRRTIQWSLMILEQL